MVARSFAFVIITALAAAPAFAQDAGPTDAGEVDQGDAGLVDDDAGPGEDDAGPVDGDCTPTCQGEVLHFCDDGEPVTLDCSETGANCKVLSEEWGADCVLPPGAECQPGYADGLSRCDGAGDSPPTNCCVDGVCGDPGDAESCTEFRPGAPTRPETPAPEGGGEASSCLGCEGIPLLSVLPLAVGLRLRRRRARR